ncbi:MAG: AAA family ATPase [Chlamydiae bacterium]|nr:AAA family ATPase [Chlamydiota bacterium]
MFEGILGNDDVKQKLIKAISHNNLSNTLLFSGPDGVGKSMFALQLAIKLMYPEGCDESILKRINDNNHPDLHIFRPEGKTSMHAISSMRDLIEQVFMAPFEAKDKVFIIEDADRMLLYSANALLKTLQEPTLDSYIILITSKSQDLLLTILSRTSRFVFSPVTEESIVSLLQNEMGKSSEEANLIAKHANGSIGLAKEIASNKSYFEKRSLLLKILSKENIFSYYQLDEALTRLDALFSDDESEEAKMKWHKEVDNLFIQLLMWYRDLHLIKSNTDLSLLFFKEEKELMLAQDLSKLCSLEKIHQTIDEAKLALDRNIKLKTCLENLFLKIGLV